MPQLALYLLGPPRVELDGVPVRFDTRKALALLACLALADGPQRRDSLAAMLWPDYAQARAALRRTLSTLQSGIGFDWIHSDQQALSLRRGDGLIVDVDVFKAHLAAASAGSGDQQRAALQAAAGLYREDFLSGFSLRDSLAFDDWQRAQAEAFRRSLSDLLERLAGLETAVGKLPEAVASARRWLSLDPLNEPAHRALMTLYAQSGQRGAAIQQYRECVRVLERELGVAPLEETTALYRELAAGHRPGSDARNGTGSLTSVASPDPPPLSIVGAQPIVPLVGRGEEWATLDRVFAALRSDGTLIVIEGPAGIGKTRLADDWLAQARVRGALTIEAHCHEGEANLAFAPFVTLLRQALALPGAAERLARVPAWLRGAAAHLVPELADALVALPADGADARLRVFEAVAAVLLDVATGPGPTLILLDDLQWADASSLDLFAYLARRLRGRRVGLVATWRADDVPVGHPLRTLLTAQLRAGAATHLPLSPLTREAVTALVATLPGIPDDMAGPLFVETEGLPLLVVAYLATLRDSGQPASGTPWELPGAVREVLRSRLNRASELGAQLLAAAAVIGRAFDGATMRLISGRSEDEVVAGIEELVRLGLLVEGRAYDFSHGRLRDLAYASTSLARRRLLHRRAAEALAARDPGSADNEDAGAVARHYELAGEARLAAVAFVHAGQHARRVAATDLALAHFERALALGHPDPGPLHAAIGDLQTLNGRYDDALARYETAAALAEPEAVPGIEARIAEVHRRRGEWSLAEQHVVAGLEALGGSTDVAQRARLTADRALTAHQSGEADQAQRLAHEALALAEGVGDPHALAQAHNLLGLLARERRDLSEAVDHLERSLSVANRLGEGGAQTAALHNLALVRANAGQILEALALAENALGLCEAQGDRHRAAALLNTLADLLHAAGRETEAMERLKQAVARFAAIGGDARQTHPGIWKLSVW